MTPEAQRIAIAETCGWTQIVNASTIRVDGLWKGYPPRGQIVGEKAEVPDYLKDLNAMHEAEATLGDKSFDYNEQLANVVFKDPRTSDFCSRPGDYVWHAAADQRAEAFLKTIGKWVEPPNGQGQSYVRNRISAVL